MRSVNYGNKSSGVHCKYTFTTSCGTTTTELNITNINKFVNEDSVETTKRQQMAIEYDTA